MKREDILNSLIKGGMSDDAIMKIVNEVVGDECITAAEFSDRLIEKVAKARTMRAARLYQTVLLLWTCREAIEQS